MRFTAAIKVLVSKKRSKFQDSCANHSKTLNPMWGGLFLTFCMKISRSKQNFRTELADLRFTAAISRSKQNFKTKLVNLSFIGAIKVLVSKKRSNF